MARRIQYRNVNVNANNIIDVSVDHFPSYCGICHKNVDPIYIGLAFEQGQIQSLKMQGAFQCTNIECNCLIIGYFSRERYPGDFTLNKQAPITPQDKEFADEINKLSSNFVQIYNQSFYAEQNDLTLISGIGYRKSLEFLIKDYLIFLDSDKENEIIKLPLGQCIDKLNNHNIKEIAKRATWLGNDETHYSRKWADKDVHDLKKLIEVTVYFIAMDVASRKYLEEMA